MRKEVVVAIVLGFLLGLLIVGGFWWTNQRPASPVGQTEEKEQPLSSEEIPVQASEEPLVFVRVNYPEEGAIIETSEVRISGQTVPGAVVVLIYAEGETIVTADDQGDFVGTALLTGGANEVKVVSYDYQGNKDEATLTIVYSTAKL